uniref:NADH-ubiquinone oxidoreductase chain 2 n=2 Tax=Phraortes TaxID=590989 RepID=E2RUQ5_PHRIL|nr:NADH dehydrogenase subunit 2 [Phraortes illepidus]YP_010601338.1 NADH dehydrogenase subunit 2 [Phraortes lii]WAL35417.1 NADH dehydrogenase subunit 2 [Phraortes lii]BAJ24439.1 NADH dehydrogenase subunit 2 [Phraortes illepidus]
MNKTSNMMFMIMIMMSVIIAISSNSWFTIWMGMEINMMAFMPIIIEKNNLTTKESSLMYFLVQTMASMLLIMSVIITKAKMTNLNMNNMLMMTALMMKSGVSPFHFWLPKTMEGLSWMNCLIMMTWQKIIPLLMMSHMIKMSNFLMMTTTLSVMIGSIGGLNQTSLRKLMAYSSISNNGWMLAAMLISEMLWITYFIMYSILMMIMTMTMDKYKIYHLNQLMNMNENNFKKLILMMNMLSISGLPPMMGFLMKWMVLQASLNLKEMMMMMLLIMITLITIYYYLRIMYSAMVMTNTESKWKIKNTLKNNKMMLINIISMMGLMLVSMIIMM